MSINTEREARRLSFDLVPETCPGVDQALADAGDAIKALTTQMRTRWLESVETLMDERDELNAQLTDAEDRIRQLEQEVGWLQAALDAAGGSDDTERH